MKNWYRYSTIITLCVPSAVRIYLKLMVQIPQDGHPVLEGAAIGASGLYFSGCRLLKVI